MQPSRVPLSVGYRRSLLDTLSSKTREFLIQIYGSSMGFIYAEENETFEAVNHLEEACLTFEFGMDFEPSATLVLDILTRTTNYDYITPSKNVYPIVAAEGALNHAIKRYLDRQ